MTALDRALATLARNLGYERIEDVPANLGGLTPEPDVLPDDVRHLAGERELQRALTTYDRRGE